MRKPLVLIISGATFLSPFMAANVALATTKAPQSKHILLDGHAVSNPFYVTAKDPNSHSTTTFMPIAYIMPAFTKIGVKSTWDGHNWRLTLPKSMSWAAPKTSIKASAQANIYINGTLVQTAPKLVIKDPRTKKDTTLVPIWYVMQVLNQLNFSSSWDGVTWNMVNVAPLMHAQSDTAAAQYGETTSTNAVTFHVNLNKQYSAAGVKIPDSTMKSNFVSQMGTLGGQYAALGSDVATDNQGNTKTMKEFVNGNQIYTNDGSGWVNATGTSNADLLGLQSGGDNAQLDVSALKNVRITTLQNGTLEYSATLGSKDLSKFLGPVLDSLGSSTSASALKSILPTGSGNVVMDVVGTQGQYYVSDFQMNIKSTLTGAVFATLAGQADAKKIVDNVVLNVKMNMSMSYNQPTITAPSDLTLSGSNNGSGGTSNTVNNG